MTEKTLVLEIMNDGTVTGTAGWDLISGPGGDRIDSRTENDVEHLIGSFNQHDNVFFLVETEENGFWHCRAISKDLIHCHLIQPGSKHVSSFGIFTRDPD